MTLKQQNQYFVFGIVVCVMCIFVTECVYLHEINTISLLATSWESVSVSALLHKEAWSCLPVLSHVVSTLLILMNYCCCTIMHHSGWFRLKNHFLLLRVVLSWPCVSLLWACFSYCIALKVCNEMTTTTCLYKCAFWPRLAQINSIYILVLMVGKNLHDHP